jgi:hypothetical protein
MSCIDCKKRTLGCHATCEDYREYREKLDQANKRKQEDAEYRGYNREKEVAFIHDGTRLRSSVSMFRSKQWKRKK